MASHDNSSASDLASKLDDDIDKFMEQLASERKSERDVPSKPFDVDTWWKEMQAHPMFMEAGTAVGDNVSDEVAALQAMKFDTEGDDPMIVADTRRLEGNRHFQAKKYRWAVEAYTQGVRARCPDVALNVKLLNNRSAAHYFLANYRSALVDCQLVLRLDAHNTKVALRACECLLALGRGRQAQQWMTTVIDAGKMQMDERQREKCEQLRHAAEQSARVNKRDERRAQAKALQMSAHREVLFVTLHGRKYNMHPPLADTLEMFDSTLLEVNIPQMDAVCSVSIDENNGELSWPALIVYDMCQQTDFVRAFREGTVLIGHIFFVRSFVHKRVSCSNQMAEILSTPPDWDEVGEYTVDNIEIFVTEKDAMDEMRRMKVDANKTLAQMLRQPNVFIERGLVVLFVRPVKKRTKKP